MIIIRNKNTIGGLVQDLATLQTNIDSANTARAAADGDLTRFGTTWTGQSINDLVSAILYVDNKLTSSSGGANDALAAETAARIAADQALQAAINIINGDATVTGSIAKAIADLVGGAPVALDTLKEIADYISVNPDATVATAITNHINDAITALIGGATTANDTLGKIEANLALALQKSANLSDVADVATARTNLGVYSKTETDTAIRLGGALPLMESLVVAGSNITLSNAPKNGLNGVMNFGTVRYTDNATGHSYDAPLIATADPKVFSVSTNVANEWDTFTVVVQYFYVATA